MSRERIFAEIHTERMAQDSLWGGPEHDDLHNANDWLAIIIRHLGLAANDEGAEAPERYRKQLIRVAAIAVAAVESHDRVHGVHRPAGDYTAGSGY